MNHGDEFPGVANAKQYVELARDFVANPPRGTMRLIRANGDKLSYHLPSNTFAVQRSDGAIRTMFRPDKEIGYWMNQH